MVANNPDKTYFISHPFVRVVLAAGLLIGLIAVIPAKNVFSAPTEITRIDNVFSGGLGEDSGSDVAVGENGGQETFVAVSVVGKVATSIDSGSTWSSDVQASSLAVVAERRIERFDDRWVLISKGLRVESSTDLVTWTAESTTYENTGCNSLVRFYDPTDVVEVTHDGSSYGIVGVAWNQYYYIETSPQQWKCVDLDQQFAQIAVINDVVIGVNSSGVFSATVRAPNAWSSGAFEQVTSVPNDLPELRAVWIQGGTVWVSGANGYVAKSTDGGESFSRVWSAADYNDGTTMDPSGFIGGNEAIILTAAGGTGGPPRVQFSDDDGATWSASDSQVVNQLSLKRGVSGSSSIVVVSNTDSVLVLTLPEPVSSTVPDSTVPSDTSTTVPSDTSTTVPSDTSTTVPSDTSTTVPSDSTASIGADGVAHLATDGTFPHADLNGCQYVDRDGAVSDTAAVVDLTNERISCGAENDLQIDLEGNEEGATTTLDGQLVFFIERQGIASGFGFLPGSTAEVWLASEPRFLGTVEVAADGTWEKVFDVPADIAAGEHTIQAEGTGYDGSDQAVNAGVMINARAASAELPSTGSGSAFWPFAVIAIGVGLLLRVSRRQVAG